MTQSENCEYGEARTKGTGVAVVMTNNERIGDTTGIRNEFRRKMGKRIALIAVVTILAMLAGCIPSPTSSPTPSGTPTPTPTHLETVTFPDENLEAAIKDGLGKPVGEEIIVVELAGLTKLEANGHGIADLSGLEYCTSLTELNLSRNSLSDVWPLAALANLTRLELNSSQIRDISGLSSLTNLTRLELNNNQISDISPLSSLANLTELSLVHNQISDISALAALANLTRLELNSNQIGDISGLSSLINLTLLRLARNEISDISALAALTKLTRLELNDNEISDISALSSLTNLTELLLLDNQISDVKPLVNNRGLATRDYVSLQNNNLDLWEGSEDMYYIGYLEGRGLRVDHDPLEDAP